MDTIIVPFNNILLKSCSYVIVDENLWLIDCGDSIPIISYLRSCDKNLQGIFLTHCHQDHVYGICDVLKEFPSAQIYCSYLTAKGLLDDGMNLSYIMPEYSFCFEKKENINILSDGIHKLNGLTIEAISTPGHSDDCMSYAIGCNIFTGDSYMPHANVFAKWPRSDKNTALKSENFLKRLITGRHLVVYPGHWK